MSWKTNRRDFLKLSTGLGVGIAALNGQANSRKKPNYSLSSSYKSPNGFAAAPMERVRVAFVGVGLQGGGHVRNFLGIDKVEIVAICDVDTERAKEVQGWITESGRPAPELYTRGDWDFKRMCERDDIDLVYNSTPWRWHVPACVEAMVTGKHVAVEVPAAYTIDGCWELVETAERTNKHCVMMENCCYGRSELMVLKMVRSGLLGELLHAEAAYIHDLRGIKFSDKNEGLWRLEHSANRDGNLYPTHGLGPVAQCMDINRGDRFDYIVSMSSNACGLNLYAQEHLEAHDKRIDRKYVLGDMNSSLIKTKKGLSIMVQHDTTSPRPYSRINLLQGTKGTFRGFPDRIYVEGRNKKHSFDGLDSYREAYDHSLWNEKGEAAKGAGHGGMDYLEDYRLVKCLRNGTPTDMDVYDAAALSVVTELSEISVANRSQSIDFPDFTRGRWSERKPGYLGKDA